jgi:glutathione S-transferase
MADLTLYHAAPSRSMGVHWLLEELGVPYDLHWLSLEANDHKTPEFLAINPMGRVPALRHGDMVMTETAAIFAYLADAFPGAGLSIPIGSPLRGPYYRWLFFGPATAEPSILWHALGKIVSGVDYKPFATVEDVANTLRLAVADREFIVGDHFTPADVMIGGTIMWGTRMMPVLPPHPEIIAYLERLERRPAYQRASRVDREHMAV